MTAIALEKRGTNCESVANSVATSTIMRAAIDANAGFSRN